MAVWRRLTGLATAVVVTGCLNDPAAPAVYRLEVRPDPIRFLALRDTIRPRVLVYQDGRYVAAPFSRFRTSDTTVATVDNTGLVTSHRVGTVRLFVESPHGAVGGSVVSVTQAVAHVSLPGDTIRLDALNAMVPLSAVARDPLGSIIANADFRYGSADSTIASVDASGLVRARANGSTRVWAIASAESSSTIVRVTQRAMQVKLGTDTARFDALGVDRVMSASATDSLGSPLSVSGTVVALSDTTVARRVDSITVRSVGDGTAIATISIAGQLVQLPIEVAQVAQSLNVQVPSGIMSVSPDSLLPVSCQAVDANGFPLPDAPSVESAANGLWTGTACGALRAQRSGVDTLQVQLGAVHTSVPVAIALQPQVTPVEDVIVEGDTTWMGDPWAPSADTAPVGGIELYFGNYVYDSTTESNRANLERLVSSDGLHFQHDTLMLPHGADIDQDDGRGIENAVVFPAAGGSGWQMLYAGGNEASGWSVYGATSVDRRSWVKNGQVIGNGYPATTRPAGEGLVVDRLSDGTWRLLMGAYEPSPSTTNTFSITEWHSTDQVSWSFVGSLVSAPDVPLSGIRVVYAPTVRQIGPSLWRMAFTADNFSGGAFSGGQSSIWSAVSTDFQHWQIEGVLVSVAGGNVMYSTLARDHIYFIRRGPDGINHLATAVVQMP